ncbi:conjugal transfer protein TraQ [Trinickia sp. EG282A]|uniref:conjugal transfer protein TraQ n=1 Tax=Trinickia sp. EG282A TaxID=3237013 RepID=UPI0034D2904A
MDLTTIVVNIAQDIIAFQALAQTVAVGIGIFYCSKAIADAMRKSASPGADISGQSIFAAFFIGALIVHFSGAMNSTLESMGESDATYGLVSYSGASAAGAFAPAVNAVLTIISTFGWWYGLKGWTMLRRASNGGGGGGYEDYAWKGFIHILGGAALVNITATLDAFKATIGLTS